MVARRFDWSRRTNRDSFPVPPTWDSNLVSYPNDFFFPSCRIHYISRSVPFRLGPSVPIGWKQQFWLAAVVGTLSIQPFNYRHELHHHRLHVLPTLCNDDDNDECLLSILLSGIHTVLLYHGEGKIPLDGGMQNVISSWESCSISRGRGNMDSFQVVSKERIHEDAA